MNCNAWIWLPALFSQNGCTVCITLLTECTLHELHAVTFNLLVFFPCVGLMKGMGFDASYAFFSSPLSTCGCIITSVPSLNLMEVIQYRYFLLCQFKIRLFIVIFLAKSWSTALHIGMSMGSLFFSWQLDKCCIVRFLALNGLWRFVSGLRVECQPCPQSGYLSPQCRALPQGNYFRGIPTHPFTSSTTWLNDVCPFEDCVLCLLLLESGILAVSYKIICGYEAGGQTPGGKFIAGCS